MSLYKLAEKFVLNKLKSISNGSLKLVNYDGKVYHFGDLENSFFTDIKIINPKILIVQKLLGKYFERGKIVASIYIFSILNSLKLWNDNCNDF